MASQAACFKNGFNLLGEINRVGCWRRQLPDLRRGKRAERVAANRQGHDQKKLRWIKSHEQCQILPEINKKKRPAIEVAGQILI
ncbi:MAG: hypothetical protein ABJC04_02310, partial [Verrucomicrobiota bacterium]